MPDKYETIIGLEVHIQLKTKSKMFCACDNDSEKAEPNTNICPTCMGIVGTLPRMNKIAFVWALRTSLALHGEIAEKTIWDRKSYFYPDLPKGYQISQFDHPLSEKGYLDIIYEDKEERIKINRLHLEEDAGKLIHPPGKQYSLIDLNRAGTPLMEIVTEPVISSPQAAKEFLKELQRIVRYLDVSDADMEKGHLRCDASISLRPKGEKKLYPRSEIKNLNSFRAVEKALEYEYQKHLQKWESNQVQKKQETVGWIENKGKTEFLRTKEESNDYRYFPDPDIPPIEVDKELIEEQRTYLPVLPSVKKKEYLDLGLKDFETDIIIRDKSTTDYFDKCLAEVGKKEHMIKTLINWTLKVLLPYSKNIELEAKHFSSLVKTVANKELTRLVAENIFKLMVYKKISFNEAKKAVCSDKDSLNLSELVKETINEKPDVIQDFKNGKDKALNMLIGCIMKKSKGMFPPEEVIKEIKKQL